MTISKRLDSALSPAGNRVVLVAGERHGDAINFDPRPMLRRPARQIGEGLWGFENGSTLLVWPVNRPLSKFPVRRHRVYALPRFPELHDTSTHYTFDRAWNGDQETVAPLTVRGERVLEIDGVATLIGFTVRFVDESELRKRRIAYPVGFIEAQFRACSAVNWLSYRAPEADDVLLIRRDGSRRRVRRRPCVMTRHANRVYQISPHSDEPCITFVETPD